MPKNQNHPPNSIAAMSHSVRTTLTNLIKDLLFNSICINPSASTRPLVEMFELDTHRHFIELFILMLT